MKNFWNYFIWFVATMFVITGGAEFMNKPDTLAAVLGLFFIALWIWITLESKLLTEIHLKNLFKAIKNIKNLNKNEESSEIL